MNNYIVIIVIKWNIFLFIRYSIFYLFYFYLFYYIIIIMYNENDSNE
jgi:hypothetical protein